MSATPKVGMHEWNAIQSEDDELQGSRFRVPGGWIYDLQRLRDKDGRRQPIFVPDPNGY